jgi:hypothetical protein
VWRRAPVSKQRPKEVVDVPMTDRTPLRDGPVARRRIRRKEDVERLEQEVLGLNERLDALLEAVNRMARQHYRSPLLPENSLSSALHDARRR